MEIEQLEGIPEYWIIEACQDSEEGKELIRSLNRCLHFLVWPKMSTIFNIVLSTVIQTFLKVFI